MIIITYCNFFADLTKLVAIGGNADIRLYEVEVVDLLDKSSNCGFIASYPIEIADHSATYLDGLVKSCGGTYYDFNENSYETISDCYDYDPATDEWTQADSLLTPRYGMGSSVVENTWLVSGGQYNDGDYFYFVNDTEVWSESTGSFELGSAALPEVMSSHCQATINTTHIFLTDTVMHFNEDDPQEPYSPKAYILDYNENVWIQVDDVPVKDDDGEGYHSTSCGRISNSVNGLEIVVAADGYTHIFNLGTLEWRDGPHLLPAGHYYASAQLENTLVLAGGEDSADNMLDTIYIFDNERYEWLLLEQTLQIARQDLAIAAVPADFIQC